MGPNKVLLCDPCPWACEISELREPKRHGSKISASIGPSYQLCRFPCPSLIWPTVLNVDRRHLYGTLLYYTILYHTILYHTIPYHTTPHHTIPYHTIPYHTMFYCTVTYYVILYYTVLYYTKLCCIVLYSNISYHTIL